MNPFDVPALEPGEIELLDSLFDESDNALGFAAQGEESVQ